MLLARSHSAWREAAKLVEGQAITWESGSQGPCGAFCEGRSMDYRILIAGIVVILIGLALAVQFG